MSGKVYAKNINTRRISRVSREAFQKMQASLEYESAGSWERKYNEFLKSGAIWPLEQALHLLAGEDPEDPRWGSNFNNSRTVAFKKIRKLLDDDYSLDKITLTETKSIDGTILGAENIVFIRWAMTKDFATRLPEVFIEFVAQYPIDNKAETIILDDDILYNLEKANSFSYKDGSFYIRYQRKNLPFIEAIDGLKFLELLLKNPNKKISASKMYCFYNQSVTAVSITMDELVGFQEGYTAHPKSDKQAIKDYRNGLKVIPQLIEEAQNSGNLEEVANLEFKQEWLEKRLNEDTYRGKSTNFSDDDNAWRQAVQKSIERAFKKIGKYSSELERHLRNSIRTGYDCVYIPAEPIEWS